MAVVWPAHQSLNALSQRLPLLERLAASGRIHPAAIERIMATVEADLKTLSNPEESKRLHGAQAAKAEKMEREVGAALAHIRASLTLQYSPTNPPRPSPAPRPTPPPAPESEPGR
jgi:hypothetical protein